MNLHANAKLGLAGRRELVLAIESGISMRAAATAFGVSPPTAHRWWHPATTTSTAWSTITAASRTSSSTRAKTPKQTPAHSSVPFASSPSSPSARLRAVSRVVSSPASHHVVDEAENGKRVIEEAEGFGEMWCFSTSRCRPFPASKRSR
jgi:transposase-like protein